MGIFGKNGAGRNIAGHLGDALMQMGGMQPTYGPAMQARQRAMLEEEQYQRRQQDQMGQWVAQQEYQRANPTPANNDTVADYNFILQAQGKEAADAFLRNKHDPIITVNEAGPNGSVVTKYIPRSQLDGAMPPKPPVLDAPPPDAQPIGGAPQAGARPFRRGIFGR